MFDFNVLQITEFLSYLCQFFLVFADAINILFFKDDTGDILDIHGNIDFDSFPGEDETEQEVVQNPAGTEKRTKTHIEEKKLNLTNNLKNPSNFVQKSNDNKRYVYHICKYPKKSCQHLKMTLNDLVKGIHLCAKNMKSNGPFLSYQLNSKPV